MYCVRAGIFPSDFIPAAVCAAPTGAQAPPAVIRLPWSCSNGPVPPPAVQFEQVADWRYAVGWRPRCRRRPAAGELLAEVAFHRLELRAGAGQNACGGGRVVTV